MSCQVVEEREPRLGRKGTAAAAGCSAERFAAAAREALSAVAGA